MVEKVGVSLETLAKDVSYQSVYEEKYPKCLAAIMRAMFPTVAPVQYFAYSLGFPKVESVFANAFMERMELRKETLPCHYIYLVALEHLVPLHTSKDYGMSLLDLFRESELILHEYSVRHNIGEIFTSLASGFYLCQGFEHSLDYISTGSMISEKVLSLIQGDLLWTSVEVPITPTFFYPSLAPSIVITSVLFSSSFSLILSSRPFVPWLITLAP